MNKSKILLYLLIFFLFLSAAVNCFASDKQSSQIKGKFVFDSNRLGRIYDAFIAENGKTRLLSEKVSHPAWSTDGKRIACNGTVDSPKKYGFWIIDSEGNKKEFIETPEGSPSNLNWSPDDTKIYYVAVNVPGKPGYENKVYCYDIPSKTHTKIIELDEKFSISNMKISPKGDKLMIGGSGPNRDLKLYLSNSDGTDLKVIGRYRVDCVWYPDNEHIGYITNIDENGQMYDKSPLTWGYFFKMNVNTGEVEKLWLNKTPFLMNLKISRDGKYFYYIAAAPGGGRAVFVSPIDNPDKRIQITYPIFLTPATHGRSQDDNPDWYQG